MNTEWLPLLTQSVVQAHAEGWGVDELLPAGLAVLIGIGVYTVLANGGGPGSGRRAKRARRRDE